MRWLISDKIKNDFSSTATEITDHPEGTPGGKKEEEEKETADSSSKSQSGSNKKVEEEEGELKTNTSPACSHVSPPMSPQLSLFRRFSRSKLTANRDHTPTAELAAKGEPLFSGAEGTARSQAPDGGVAPPPGARGPHSGACTLL